MSTHTGSRTTSSRSLDITADIYHSTFNSGLLAMFAQNWHLVLAYSPNFIPPRWDLHPSAVQSVFASSQLSPSHRTKTWSSPFPERHTQHPSQLSSQVLAVPARTLQTTSRSVFTEHQCKQVDEHLLAPTLEFGSSLRCSSYLSLIFISPV